MRMWRLIGHYDAETQAYSACAGPLQTSPFNPDFDGTLVGLRVMEGQQAATSLIANVQLRLTCTIWKPNAMDVCINGGGLKTVPVGFQNVIDYQVNQPVKAGLTIGIEGRNEVATAVTVSILILGCFEV